MNKISILTILIIALCTGCTPKPQVTPNLQIPTSSPAIFLSPLRTYWEIEDQPVLSTNEFSLVIYALWLTGNDTVLLYSIEGIGADQLTGPGNTIQLKDNTGQGMELMSSGSLARLDSVEFGYLKFPARPVDSQNLILQVTHGTKREDLVEIPVARLTNAPEDPSVYQLRTYLLGTDDVFTQGDLRISFVGWAAPSSGLSATITPSVQISAYPPPVGFYEADALPTPTAISSVSAIEATFAIEGENDEVRTLYVRFLPDGQISGDVSQ
jgi:hypothetical protein